MEGHSQKNSFWALEKWKMYFLLFEGTILLLMRNLNKHCQKKRRKLTAGCHGAALDLPDAATELRRAPWCCAGTLEAPSRDAMELHGDVIGAALKLFSRWVLS